MSSRSFAVTGVRVFDGDAVIERATVLVDGETITGVAAAADVTGREVVDGAGATLIPGLIDCHAHPTGDALALAMLFGVTTEIDMFTTPERLGTQRERAAKHNDLADIRSASTGATVLGGHPSMLIGLSFREQFPVVTGEEDAAQFVRDRIAEGADFIKLLIDDGTAGGHPSPTLTGAMAKAVVAEAHRHGLMAVAHATSAANAVEAVQAGADGLAHVFMDQPPTPEVIAVIKEAGIFVIPTLVTMGSMAGDLTGAAVAEDERARRYIPEDWRGNLCQCWQFGSPSSLANAQRATAALHEAGVPILAGTDAADVGVLGTAHGASLHQELAQLVECGLSPIEALAAATSRAASAWRLDDRGRIAPGLQADLVLIDGDPTTDITDSLSIRAVWRRGELLERTPKETA
ncbi:amidohydrolase family protein [Actinocorallia sp. A-T 12471]|uniref:amidohydrolase family protein n=1 Tax=Actinocorallia sp. A-T 12471 TaxID=3089813 RepID=UPI0029CEC51D|nr:amidohydrolase family protein [Actinocorallia sp. A-T 12471]MDX6741682.1 amidohydrolase family protein [Actinocorallia sp. A-T 12471]